MILVIESTEKSPNGRNGQENMDLDPNLAASWTRLSMRNFQHV